MNGTIDSPADRAQRIAADPGSSSWVTASAGTGKTKVLTDRVLRLLLQQADPARILCLTYTNAAAAEMENRILASLARWAVAGAPELAEDLQRLHGSAPEDSIVRQARQLFARVLDTPGGLKIETIHGFCQSVLKRFPLEAGVSPHFNILEGNEAAEMRDEALRQVLGRAREQEDSSGPLFTALGTVTRYVGEQRFVEILDKLMANRSRIRTLRGRHAEAQPVESRIRGLLDLDEGETRDGFVRHAVSDATVDRDMLTKVAAALATGRDTARQRGEKLARWLACNEEERATRFELYCEVFFTDAGERRASIMDKASAEAFPDGPDFMDREGGRLEVVLDRIRAAEVAEASGALTRLGLAILDAYEDEKAASAYLDYDDLIARMRQLVENTEAAWVLYKLDGGLDHILIDEAQDTSPDQWRLIEALAVEFFSGEGRERPTGALERTIFAVGDYKQSIYRFQGADPDRFREMRSFFADRVEAAERTWQPVELDISFRSTEAVLEAVDAVFNRTAAQQGVTTPDEPAHHKSHRKDEHGSVTLWPMLPKIDKPAIEPWTLPVQEEPQADAKRQVATGIACIIAGWCDGGSLAVWSGEGESRTQRPVRPGDIVILVRSRNEFVDYVVSELKASGIAVAGADRMILPEQIAVKDMLALARFLLLPDDDLSLAEVLRGPLCDVSEEGLFAVAHGRAGSLWRSLGEAARSAPGSPEAKAHGLLRELLGQTDYMPLYELFADVLEARGGRRRIIGRLGREAEDPIDEFLSLALAYQRQHAPSLEGFVRWVVAGGAEVKRDLELASPDEVRVMTVHGAKGLEAPVVVLPDTFSMPAEFDGREPVLWHRASGLPLWAPRKTDHDPVAREERRAFFEKEMEEYRRLLYVAMTRAADHLFVGGWQADGKAPKENSWYAAVADGLGAAGAESRQVELADGWSGEALVLARGTHARDALAAITAMPRDIDDLPPWAFEAAPEEPVPPSPLAPSRPSEDEPAVLSPLSHDRRVDAIRFRRGNLIHRLLQSLPDLEPGRREPAARSYLAREGLDEAEARDLADEVLRVMNEPGFAALFGAGSMAEVPVTGIVGSQIVSGQIDRLVETESGILIVDYKSNRPAPPTEAGVAPLYLRQMAAYRALVARIYGGRPVSCALLWTEVPRLMPLGDSLLDSHVPT